MKGYGPDGADKVGERTYSTRTVAGGAVASPPYSDQQVTGQSDFLHADGKGTPARQHRLDGYAPAGALCSPPYMDSRLPPGVSNAVRNLALAGQWDEAIALVQQHEADQVDRGTRGSIRTAESIRRHIEAALHSEAGGYEGAPEGVISSPPYGDLAVLQGAGVTHRILKIAREEGMVAAVAAYRKDVIETQPAHGRWDDENIQRHIELALASAASGGYCADARPEEIGGALASPPYGGRDDHGDDPHPERMEGAGNQFRGYDGAINSPPYAGHVGHADGEEEAGRGIRVEKGLPGRYSSVESAKSADASAQIGNLRDPKGDVDRVIAGSVTSPPWADVPNHDPKFKLYKGGGPAYQMQSYGTTPGQLGQMEKETYCAAMLAVYRQLYLVLRPGGVVALVTKNPVKKGAIRRLDLDTIRLMEAANFQFLERQMAMLADPETVQEGLFEGAGTVHRRERKSFFKRLFEKKNPHLRVDHEDVLWFRKSYETKEVKG